MRLKMLKESGDCNVDTEPLYLSGGMLEESGDGNVDTEPLYLSDTDEYTFCDE
jgi:hypothetical protein